MRCLREAETLTEGFIWNIASILMLISNVNWVKLFFNYQTINSTMYIWILTYLRFSNILTTFCHVFNLPYKSHPIDDRINECHFVSTLNCCLFIQKILIMMTSSNVYLRCEYHLFLNASALWPKQIHWNLWKLFQQF